MAAPDAHTAGQDRMAPASPGLASHELSCYIITMNWPLSLTTGAGRRLALTAPLLAALWGLVLWAMT
jgi:hypothetical protein